MLPGVLLASEMGGGRGHAVTLAAVARALGPGHRVLAALPSLRHAGVLASLGITVQQAPAMRYSPEARANPERAGNASWADYLAACGFARPEALNRGLAFWRKAIIDNDISLLVADYAPLALLAARGLQAEGWQVVSVAIGTGYGLPPATLAPLPQLLPDFGRVIHPEAEVLSGLNRVLAEQGMAPLPRLAAVHGADHALVQSLPSFDPYAAWRAPGSALPPETGGPVPAAAAGGDGIFVYFSTAELADPAVVAALAGLPLPRFGYLPGAAPEVLARLAASGMHIAPAPLAPAEIAARARMVLCAGQHGMVSLAALAGLPVVALPQQLEQLFNARRAEAAGFARLLWRGERHAAGIAAVLREAHADAALARAARELGARLRSEAGACPGMALTARLAPVMAAARRAAASAG